MKTDDQIRFADSYNFMREVKQHSKFTAFMFPKTDLQQNSNQQSSQQESQQSVLNDDSLQKQQNDDQYVGIQKIISYLVKTFSKYNPKQVKEKKYWENIQHICDCVSNSNNQSIEKTQEYREQVISKPTLDQARAFYQLAQTLQLISDMDQKLNKFIEQQQQFDLQKLRNFQQEKKVKQKINELIQNAEKVFHRQKKLQKQSSRQLQAQEKLMCSYIKGFIQEKNTKIQDQLVFAYNDKSRLLYLSLRKLRNLAIKDERCIQMLRRVRIFYLKSLGQLIQNYSKCETQNIKNIIQKVIQQYLKIRTQSYLSTLLGGNYTLISPTQYYSQALKNRPHSNILSNCNLSYEQSSQTKKMNFRRLRVRYYNYNQDKQKQIMERIQSLNSSNVNVIKQLKQAKKKQYFYNSKLKQYAYQYIQKSQVLYKYLQNQIPQQPSQKIKKSKGSNLRFKENMTVQNFVSYIAERRKQQKGDSQKRAQKNNKQKPEQVIQQPTLDQARAFYQLAQTLQLISDMDQKLNKFIEQQQQFDLQKLRNCKQEKKVKQKINELIQNAEKVFHRQKKLQKQSSRQYQEAQENLMCRYIKGFIQEENTKMSNKLNFIIKGNSFDRCFDYYRFIRTSINSSKIAYKMLNRSRISYLNLLKDYYDNQQQSKKIYEGSNMQDYLLKIQDKLESKIIQTQQIDKKVQNRIENLKLQRNCDVRTIIMNSRDKILPIIKKITSHFKIYLEKKEEVQKLLKQLLKLQKHQQIIQ